MVRPYTKKIRSWTDESLQNALNAIEEGFPCKTAAQRHRVPYHILKCRLYKKLRGEPFTGQGKKPLLNKKEETDFAYYINTLCHFGFHPMCMDELLEMTSYIIARRGLNDGIKNVCPGRYWAVAFARRHNFSFKEMRVMNGAHTKPGSVRYEAVVQNFYDRLEEITTLCNLGPNQIWTCHEVGFPNYFLGVDLTFDADALDSTTCVAICSATGQAMAPMIIHTGKRSSMKRIDSTFCATSETGHLTPKLFQDWFSSLLTSISMRPLFIIIDSALSHLTLNTVEVAVSEGIHFIKQPCLTKKPLDLCFERFKVKWQAILRNWMKENMELMSEQDFARQLSGIWYKCLSQKLIVRGYELSEIYPLVQSRFPSVLSNGDSESSMQTSDIEGTKNSITSDSTSTSSDVCGPLPSQEEIIRKSGVDNGCDSERHRTQTIYYESLCEKGDDIPHGNKSTECHCWCSKPPPPVSGKRWIPIWSLVNAEKSDRSASFHQIKDSKVVIKRMNFITNGLTYKIADVEKNTAGGNTKKVL